MDQGKSKSNSYQLDQWVKELAMGSQGGVSHLQQLSPSQKYRDERDKIECKALVNGLVLVSAVAALRIFL